MQQLHVVVGGQLGSEGKGHVTAWLAREVDPTVVVRVAGPNAGHTAYDDNGKRWSLRQVPVAAVAHDACALGIAAGSEIDPEVLCREVENLEGHGFKAIDRLTVDPQATVIQRRHQQAEQKLIGRIGSTGKGIGAARADRLMRNAMTWGEWVKTNEPADRGLNTLTELHTSRVADFVGNSYVHSVIIEGTQGYGLGLHAGHYPRCTTSDCTAIDFLAMAGVSPWAFDGYISVWPVFRTYPIRVAGNSGELFGELDWADLAERTGGHVQPERTTVTNKVRRVGLWDPRLAAEAIRANGGVTASGRSAIRPVLTFLDYWHPEVYGQISADTWTDDVWASVDWVSRDLGCPVQAVGTGPQTIVKV
jgi:adenylosuccinate synthase